MTVTFTPKSIYSVAEPFGPGNNCAICLDDENKPLKTDEHKHTFHAECIDDWIKQQISADIAPFCPLCKREIVPSLKEKMIKEIKNVAIDAVLGGSLIAGGVTFSSGLSYIDENLESAIPRIILGVACYALFFFTERKYNDLKNLFCVCAGAVVASIVAVLMNPNEPKSIKDVLIHRSVISASAGSALTGLFYRKIGKFLIRN